MSPVNRVGRRPDAEALQQLASLLFFLGEHKQKGANPRLSTEPSDDANRPGEGLAPRPCCEAKVLI